jgi:predicted dehydrogenase
MGGRIIMASSNKLTSGHGNGKVRFGIVGCGSIGPTHAGALAQIGDAELVAVADPVADRAAACSET